MKHRPPKPPEDSPNNPMNKLLDHFATEAMKILLVDQMKPSLACLGNSERNYNREIGEKSYGVAAEMMKARAKLDFK